MLSGTGFHRHDPRAPIGDANLHKVDQFHSKTVLPLHDDRQIITEPDFRCIYSYHHICRSTASQSPVLTRGSICVPPIVIYLPLPRFRLNNYGRRAFSAAGLEHSPGFYPGIQQAAETVLGIYLKCTCLHDTSASSALGVLTNYALYKSTHSLTIKNVQLFHRPLQAAWAPSTLYPVPTVQCRCPQAGNQPPVLKH